jgi:hypothetical protein
MELSIKYDRVFYCPSCQKRIEIPLFTELTMSQADMAGIVGEAFGERWKQELEKLSEG